MYRYYYIYNYKIITLMSLIFVFKFYILTIPTIMIIAVFQHNKIILFGLIIKFIDSTYSGWIGILYTVYIAYSTFYLIKE